MTIVILFWILYILAAIGVFIPDSVSPFVGRGRWAVVLILIGILGYHIFQK